MKKMKKLFLLGILIANYFFANAQSQNLQGFYNSTGYFFHPSNPRELNSQKEIIQISQDTYQVGLGDLGGSNFNFQFTINANNQLVNWVPLGSTQPLPSSNFMTADNPGGFTFFTSVSPGTAPYVQSTYNNRFDPATKTFYLHYGYGSGASDQNGFTRQVYEQLVFVGNPLALNSFSPPSGTSGTSITINGSGFNTVNYVRIGSAIADSFSIVSDNILKVVAGGGSTGKIYISNALGTDSIGPFSYSSLSQKNTQWKYLGSPVISDIGGGAFVNIGLSKDNIPFIVYRDVITQKAKVKKYTGISWINLGSDVSDGKCSNTTIAVGTAGAPVVCFVDSVNGNKLTVKKWNGSTWVIAGNAGFAFGLSGGVASTDMALDKNDIPYVIARDTSNNLLVYKQNGSSWLNLGGAISSSNFDASIAVDKLTSTPYIIFSEYSTGNQATVKKYVNGAWVTVGNASFTNGVNGIYYPSISIDKNGIPVVAFQDDNGFERVSVYKLMNNTWTLQGPERFSKSHCYYLSLALNKNNVPQVAFKDDSYILNYSSVMSLDANNQWNYVGDRGFGQGIFSKHSLAIDSNNVSFIAYYNAYDSNKVSVMTYGAPKPNIGKDTTYKVCAGSIANITGLFGTLNYPKVEWSTPSPDSITAAGKYTLIITNFYGNRDTAVVTLSFNPKPNLGKDSSVKMCNGAYIKINTLYNTTNYTSVIWNTPRPDSVTMPGVYKLIVINSYGCKDTAVVTVAYDAKPNLGNDTTVKICPGYAANLTTLYRTSIFPTIVWSTPRPDSVTKASTYRLIVANKTGCRDTAYTIVGLNTKPNLGADKTLSICPGTYGHLTGLYITAGYASVAWNTNRPDSITTAGTYRLIVTNTTGCKDTAFVTVSFYTKPYLGKDTTVSICTGSTFNIRKLYDTAGYATKVWSTPKPDSAVAGIYTLIVANATGCKDTAKITIANYPASPIPGTITGQFFGVCNRSGIAYSVPNVPGLSYNWTFSTTTSVVASGQGSNAITAIFNSGFVTGLLSVTSNNGCGAGAARSVTVRATPEAPSAISGNTSVCANQTGVAYSIPSIANATSYTWTGPSGSHVSDGVTTSATTSLTTTATAVTVNFAATAGNIFAKGNNACGAGASKVLPITISCFAKREKAKATLVTDLDVALFPNPSKNEFNLLLNKNISKAPVYVRIMDVNGKKVFEAKTISGQILNVGKTLQSGLYMIEVRQGSQTKILKAVKE